MEPGPENPSEFKAFWTDLWEFIFASLPSMAGLITGGVVAAVIVVIQSTGGNIPHWIIWALVALAFFAAAFNAYRKQRRTAEIIKLDFQVPFNITVAALCLMTVWFLICYSPVVKRLTQPDFKVDSLGMQTSDEFGDLNNHFLTFNLAIINAGAPSVIRYWELKITDPDNKPLLPNAIVFYPNEWQTNWPHEGTNYTIIDTKDSFVGINWEKPIERGGMRKGFITFLVSGVSRAYLDSSDTKYDLSFWDVDGREYDLPNIHTTPPSRQ